MVNNITNFSRSGEQSGCFCRDHFKIGVLSRGGVFGHSFDTVHRTIADFGDGFLRFGRFGRNLCIGFGKRCVEIGLNRSAGLVGDPLRFRLRLSESRVIGCFCLFGLELELFSGRNIIHNRAGPFRKHRRDARQGDFREHEIDHDKRDQKPENLVGECREVELRHACLSGRQLCPVRLCCHLILLALT